ncbi:MAG: hypothetical protein ACYTGV_07300 [Planctomycetota bacterium]|jgi:hypothetical protein
MHAKASFAFLLALVLVVGCSKSGDGGAQGGFRLIEFLESGLNGIPRNRDLTFRFSAEVDPNQDFPERLKIQNVQSSQGQSDFSRAIGCYLVSGDEVLFCPRLPEAKDRGDAGFRALGNYHVFLKAGPDSLRSTDGDTLAGQQEFLFDTSEFFEDANPSEPPRSVRLLARDATTGTSTDLSRLDPRPLFLAMMDSEDLLAADRAIDPGAGGPPDFATPWVFELHVTEPLDPATVTTKYVELRQIRANALTGATTSDPDHMGDPVDFEVPILVEMAQGMKGQGVEEFCIRVTARQTLVDDARYRLTCSGEILGIDFRKEFRGDNGLTGDGQTIVDGAVFEEPGGVGYTTEFVVYDRPAITASRTVLYDPLVDGIDPETGQTTSNEELFNSALYNPATNPGTAVGFLSDFGDGSDGPFAVSGGLTEIIHTGDTPNEFMGNPFLVRDLNPNDDYKGNPLPGAWVEYDSPTPFELNLESLTVSSSSVLQVTGVNPILFRVAGIVQINGTIDLAGGDGGNAGGNAAVGGSAGAAGYPGGRAKMPNASCTNSHPSCSTFATFLNACPQANAVFPNSFNGTGPGRGYAGGEVYTYDYIDDRTNLSGTGGGGASHATLGTAGEDRRNAGGAPGSPGSACGQNVGVYNSGVVGVRGQPGPDTYGDREAIKVVLGGSGGGAGGSCYGWGGVAKKQAGAGGGGGGGSIAIYASGPILATGADIVATGGDGGDGALGIYSAPNNWISVSGAGGGGSGGTITLISGDNLTLTNSTINATGGAGGDRADTGGVNCTTCNAGGDGGKGFIFLMDEDGEIEGHIPGTPGEYDNYANGILTISEFNTARFSTISAITELFALPAADPDYLPLSPSDVVAHVNAGQRIRLYASSAKADLTDPLQPDVGSELAPMFEVALVRAIPNGIVVDITGDMGDLNPSGVPARDAFVRVRGMFEYDNGVEAALGPFAWMDEFTVTVRFNG